MLLACSLFSTVFAVVVIRCCPKLVIDLPDPKGEADEAEAKAKEAILEEDKKRRQYFQINEPNASFYTLKASKLHVNRDPFEMLDFFELLRNED